MTISRAASRCKRAVLLLCAVAAALVLTPTTQASAFPRPGDPGEFRIHNYNARGKCIGIANGLAGDWDCTTNRDQTWRWGDANAEGYHELVNGDGKCLAVNGGSTDAGARILGYECVKSSDQYWEFWTNPWGWYELVNYKGWFLGGSGSGWIVGVAGASTANGAALVLWPSLNHPDQMWY